MITFKNRYAEFDNLDDAYNENVLRNCYNREYRKNFFRFNRPNRNENLRYSHSKNFNDIRLNNNFNSYQRQNSFTPFPQLPLINNNNMNYNNNDQYQQNNLQSRSSPNMPSIISYNQNNMNHVGTPFPRYNNNFNNNNENGFISNNYDVNNVSNDNIQFFNENNSLNVSNDSQYNQENNSPNSSQMAIRQNLDNELEELEKERKLLLEKEKLNQIDFELRYLRQKRNNDLQRRLAEQQQNLDYINKIKEAELENIYNNKNQINSSNNNKLRRVNYNYRISNYRNNNNNSPYNNIYLEEKLKSNVMNDKYYMNELIDQINRMKISQQEANMQFQKKMEDLVKQNESIKMANQRMIEKIKDMKNALSEKKNNDYNNESNYDYLIKQRNDRFRQRRLFENNNDYEKNSKSVNFNNNKFYNNSFKSLDVKRIEENDNKYNNYFLGKKDKDVEEFNTLNQNLVSNSNKVVVTPLLYDNNNGKYTKNFDIYTPYENYSNKNLDGDYNKTKNYTIGNDYSSTRKENLYSIIRKNNDRLDKIREMEEKN